MYHSSLFWSRRPEGSGKVWVQSPRNGVFLEKQVKGPSTPQMSPKLRPKATGTEGLSRAWRWGEGL